MKKLIIILFICLSFQLGAQTFHALLIANTEIADIGKSCQLDQMTMTLELNSIANAIGYQIDIKMISGSAFSFENLKSEIENLKCDTGDVIFLYYSGHGFNTTDRTSKWPLLHLETGGYPLDKAHEQLKAKGARLVISLGDCCNNVVDFSKVNPKGFKVVDNAMPENNEQKLFNNLFVEARGDVLISGCERGQCAYGSSKEGGYYTNRFITALHCAVTYSNTASWKNILEDANVRMSKLNVPERQMPQYEINISKLSDPNNPDEPVTPVVSYDVINKYFNSLAGSDENRESRTELLKLNQEYFIPNTRVDVYVNTTMTEMMTIEDFTKRLVLHGNKISIINLIETKSVTNNEGKYKQITVQEVWQQ